MTAAPACTFKPTAGALCTSPIEPEGRCYTPEQARSCPRVSLPRWEASMTRAEDREGESVVVKG